MKAHPSSAIEQVKNLVRQPYSWPGGYPLFAICSDGGCLCKSCVKNEFKNVAYSTIHKSRDGWQVEGVDVNWEDDTLYCDHCGEQIESAYGD